MKFKFTALLFLALFGFAHVSFAQDEEKKPNVNTNKLIGEPLPAFAFELPDKSLLTPNVLPKQPVVVFYFDPDCDHCNKQAKMVTENPDAFEGITQIWVSWAMTVEDNIRFYKKYFLDFPHKVYVALDTQFAIDAWFGNSLVPSIYVYNQDWVRTASFDAESDPEVIAKFAHKSLNE